MKRLLYCVLASLTLAGCRPDYHPSQIYVKAEFTDVEGGVIKEASSGQTFLIRSSQFANISPNGISPNQAQLFFDNIQVPFQPAGADAILVSLPVMYLADYRSLSVRIRYNQYTLFLIERILYRPTVSGSVLAGNDGTFQMPAEMTIDGYGDLYVVDQRPAHDVIYKVTASGATSLFAGGANEFGRITGIGIDVVTLRMYVADATAQQIKRFNMSSPSVVTVHAGSGTPGNADGSGTAASFRFGTERVDNFSSNELGQGMHVDLLGNIYVGEQYGTASMGRESQIRKITPGGVVTTVTGSRITMPSGPEALHPIAGVTLLPSTGEVAYIGGSSSFFQGITRIMPSGIQVRIAGRVSNERLIDGTGSAAEFAYPKALSFNSPYYHVADGSNGAYRRVSTTGTVTTLAGVGHEATPSFCFCGITGPRDSSYVWPSVFDANPDRFKLAAKAIIMDQVGGIAVRNNSLVYLTDYGPNFKCIWKIRIE